MKYILLPFLMAALMALAPRAHSFPVEQMQITPVQTTIAEMMSEIIANNILADFFWTNLAVFRAETNFALQVLDDETHSDTAKLLVLNKHLNFTLRSKNVQQTPQAMAYVKHVQKMINAPVPQFNFLKMELRIIRLGLEIIP